MFTNNQTKLTILGCGHSESTENFNNNALISNSHGRMLIDCGHTIKHALKEQNLSIGDIDGIYISHVHGDHVFGLERVAYESRYKFQKKLKLFFHPDIYGALWNETLKGSLGYNSEGEASLEDYFDVNVIENKQFNFINEQFQLYKVNHTPVKICHGIALGKKLFYTTDTLCIPEIIEKQSFSLIFHDATTEKTTRSMHPFRT